MLDRVSTQTSSTAATPHSAGKTLHWVKNERMGGMVPEWRSDDSAQATQSQKASSFQSALAEAGAASASEEDSFGFGDIIDMVNPLHHIPVVSHLYENLTGDGIKPIARMVGGGIYGGPVGVASGLVNTVIEEETGRDLAGNALALVRGDGISLKEQSASGHTALAAISSPEERLGRAAKNAGVQLASGNLAVSANAFADTALYRQPAANPAHAVKLYAAINNPARYNS